MISDQIYDVVIIGAGIGGLICGTFLAKNGKKVLIIEQDEKPGGCIVSIIRKNCVFDMGGHLFGSGNRRGILGRCLYELGINVDFVRLNPTDQFHFEDDFIQVPTELDDYKELLKDKFPQEKQRIDPFFEHLLSLARNFNNVSKIKKFKNWTYQEFLDRWFKDNRLKSILSAEYLYIGTRPKYSSALFMAVLLASYLKDGIYYPIGGTQVFSNAIYNKFHEHGGTSLFKKRVKKILITHNNKQALGVELETRERILGKIIVSNVDACETFLKLIDRSNVPKKYLHEIKSSKRSTSLFLTFLAIRNYKKDISKKRGWHFSSYDMNRNNPLYIFIPTLFDSTIAPDSTHIIEVITAFTRDFDSVKDWDQCKKDLQSTIMRKLNLILGDDIERNLVYVDSATPKTFEKFTSNSKGVAYGWSMTPDQTASGRLQQETPIRNLYLVGHWTTPGCGITSVAVSGWNLSKKILATSL